MGAGRRPFIFVLAGVNGAGKSSVGGSLLREHGLDWFNPDSYARELVARMGLDIESANGRAWQYGRDKLQGAVRHASNFALETTLGANTIPNLLIEASATHDIIVIYCGLASPELHLERVRFRVAHGGHDIPETKIRERWNTSRLNLVRLLPYLQRLQVFDNSAPADAEGNIPHPVLVLEMIDGQTLFPGAFDLDALASTPAWARPVVQAALQ